MSDPKIGRLKLPADVDERRQWGSHRGGQPSGVPNIALSAVEVRPEAGLPENMPEPINRAERRYRERMLRRASGGSS